MTRKDKELFTFDVQSLYPSLKVFDSEDEPDELCVFKMMKDAIMEHFIKRGQREWGAFIVNLLLLV